VAVTDVRAGVCIDAGGVGGNVLFMKLSEKALSCL